MSIAKLWKSKMNKVLKFFRNFAIFLMIAGILFSNIPFNALTFLIDSYERTSGIVDKIWLVEQNHDSDVIDKFIALRKISDKLKVHETSAAISFIGSASNAIAPNTDTTVSLAGIPLQQGDLVIVSAGIGDNDNVDMNMTINTAGYTKVADLFANDTYDANLGVWWKIMGATPDTNVIIEGSLGGTDSSLAATVMAFRGVDQTTPMDVTPATITGINTMHPNPPSINHNNPSGVFTVAIGASGHVIGSGSYTFPANYTTNAISKVLNDTSDITVGMGYRTSPTNPEDPGVMTHSGTDSANYAWAAATLAIRPASLLVTTTIADGTDPGNSAIAPSSAITDLDAFTLATNSGTDSVTALTVTLTGANSFESLSEVRITSDNGSTLYFSAVTNPASNTINFSGGTPIPVNTIATQFKVRITPKTHINMPVPPGLSYAVGGTVTAFTSTNTQAGNDATTPATITVDNLSPNGATLVSGTAGDAKNTINWTTSNSADFNTTSGSVIYRWTSASAGSEVPAEGSTPAAGNTNGTATVACVISSAASSAQSKIDGIGGSAGCTTTALTNGQAYTYKSFQKDTNGNYDIGVLIGTFTPAVAITVTNYTNSTETALNYAASCTGCGARIGGGAGFRQSITITGTGFGSLTCGTGNCSTATNNIKIGTHQIADVNVTSWTATSITFLTDSVISGDTDTDWGTNFGGASALTVTASSATSAGLNFYVFPQITSVTQPAGFALDTAREYDAADSDGVITLNGTRFGSSQGAGSVTIVSQSATIGSWTNTAIQAQVPPAIVDTVNTGSISMTQGTGSNGKTHTYASTLRVLPRITGFTPGSASEGSAVTIIGNHFCQSGTCPTAGNRSTISDNVKFFNGVQVSDANVTVWGDGDSSTSGINVNVPVGATTGNVIITSNTYTSNGKSFTVLSNTPSDPTSLDQFRDAGLTQSIPIGGVGMGIASSTPIYLKQTMEVPGISGGTLYPQFEYQVAGVNFVCGAGSCGSATEGTGSAGPGPATGSKAVSPSDANYHWQARTRHNKGGSDYYSGWVSFGGNSDPNGIDVKIDTTVPVISSLLPGTPTANTATITWSTNETASTQLAYGTDMALGAGTATTTEIDISPTVTSHSVSLSNLSCGTTYYYRARSRDDAGIVGFSAIQNFATSACPVAPAKTTKFHIAGSTGTVTSGLPLSQSFSVEMPETATTTKSIFVEIKGIYSSGVAPKDVTVGVNAETTQTYVIPASSVSYFKIIHQASAISPTNTLTITPQTNTTLYILSADVNITYSYTP